MKIVLSELPLSSLIFYVACGECKNWFLQILVNPKIV